MTPHSLRVLITIEWGIAVTPHSYAVRMKHMNATLTPFSGSLMPKLNQTLNLAQISLSAHIIWYKLTF